MQKNSLHFYLLPEQTVYFQSLQKCNGATLPHEIQKDYSSQAIINALKYRYSLKYLGEEYEELFVLCIPAHEQKILPSNEKLEVQPQIQRFIKTSKQTQYRGYLSGRRSAIFIQGKKLIRYKGCGNDTQGFIFENKGLRGSHFFHTAKRQLYMTSLINNILLEEVKEPSANLPLFFYEFPNCLTQYNLRNDLKLLRKYCCVFETLGDRRVGTHLISPLEILFLNIIAVQQGELDEFFKANNRLDEYGLVELLTDFELFLQNGESFLEKYDKSKQFVNYVSFDDYKAGYQRKIKQSEKFQSLVEQIKTKFIKSSDMESLPCLESSTDWIEIFNIILQKLGWEMGQIKRIFCEKNINWGFFNDHGYFHCNAHLNNFVIKVPSENKRFILPLDFDLAFTKDQYINIDLKSPLYGERDDACFEQFFLSEYNAMEMSVSGVEIMNFKYSIREEDFNPPQEIKQARIMFRDTLIKGFRWGMRRNEQEYERINKLWNENIGSIKKLVEFCLLISANFQT